jgi:hypothetical protein
MDKNPSIASKSCSICNSKKDLRRCLCKIIICQVCLSQGENENCKQTCYLFHDDSNTTKQLYNISKQPLPMNFEALITFDKVNWIRTGITFDPNIVIDQTDANCPKFDIYYIIENLADFYSLKDSGREPSRDIQKN